MKVSLPRPVALIAEVGLPVGLEDGFQVLGGDAAAGILPTCLPARLVPGIEDIRFEDVSLYNVPGSRYDLHAVSATGTLIAVVVNSEQAGLLRIPSGSPSARGEAPDLAP
ncbi:MAG: UTRA domain-containing protein [Acidobacteria bacterium]|nr:UTRA domain-containing protein [Acidobacteriota bacterium]